MVRPVRIREMVTGPVNWDQLKEKTNSGWRLVALEWARGTEPGEQPLEELADYVPYGLRVADDCFHLEEESQEMAALVVMMEQIVQDYPLSKVAEELNRRGFRTRQGWLWSPVSVFNHLPRLIQVGPRIFNSQEWTERRKHLVQIT